jgi:DinB superfamily
MNKKTLTPNGYDRQMPPITPYTPDLENREPIRAMRETTARTRAVSGEWRPDQFERRYAPGKWDARQILVHLAQSELAFGYRVRMALTTPSYQAQLFDQDQWMVRESLTSGPDALDAFLGMAAMNIALFAALSDADRSVALTHPEYGSLTVDWVIHQTAGHQIHHLLQLEAIARR